MIVWYMTDDSIVLDSSIETRIETNDTVENIPCAGVQYRDLCRDQLGAPSHSGPGLVNSCTRSPIPRACRQVNKAIGPVRPFLYSLACALIVGRHADSFKLLKLDGVGPVDNRPSTD